MADMKTGICLLNLFAVTALAFAQVPTISSFSPAYGPIGTTVTITGTNFSTTATSNIVYFGAVKATVTSATSTSLTVTVPTGATYQPITVTVNGLTAYSSKPFIVTFAGGGSISTASFATAVGFTTGGGPYHIAIADFDGDGKPDIVTTNAGSNTISVLRNSSSSGSITGSSFANKVDFTADSLPNGIITADLDGDGKPDIVVANSNSNSISVFHNTSTISSISFATKVDFAVGSYPVFVTIGDLDGDGKPDLVVANTQSNTFSVFRNTSTSGSISFTDKVDFACGNTPVGVAISDFDGDGKPDVEVTNVGSNAVSVFRNTSVTGSISFANKVDFAAGSNPSLVTVGDFDGDGKPDLAVTHHGNDTISIFRNTSILGNITFAAHVDFVAGNNFTRDQAIGDLDGDGKLDLAVANNDSNTVSVFWNTSTIGSISFAKKVDFAIGGISWGVAIGDLDGDGKPDLALVNNSGNAVSILRNTTAVSVSIPPTPALISPASGSTGVSTSPSLSWNASSGATSYRLQVSTDSTFTTTTYDTSSLSATSKSINGLASQTKYFWRVNATNSAGTSAWSTVWSFTTASQLSISWTQMNNGLSNTQVQSLAVSSSGSIFAGTYGSGVYRSTDNGASWAQVGLTSSEVYSFAVNSSNYIFAGVGYFNLGAYLSTDNGSSWTPIGLTSSNVTSLAINSSGYVIAGTYGGVYLSTNNGTSWTSTNNGLPSSPNILSITVNPSGYIFAGMGYISAGQGVFLSTNNGASWTQDGLTTAGNVRSFAVNSSGYVFAGTDSGVFVSTNNGTSWTKTGLMSVPVYSLVISSTGYMFAGTYGSGVYFSTDNGTSWTQINNGITNTNYAVEALAISSGYVFAGTWGGGIYRAIISSAAAPPPAPTLASPSNGSTGASTSPSLSWNSSSGATSYRLQVSTDSTFATTKFDSSKILLTSATVRGLSASTRYYWRVNASDSAGTSPWSAKWSFTTTNVPPSMPTLLMPTNGSNGNPPNPKLTWNSEVSASSYGLQLSTDSNFVTVLYNLSGLTDTSKIVTALSLGTLYYWHVNATNPIGTSPWSATWGFTVAPIAVVPYKPVQSGNVKLVYTVKTSEILNLSKFEYSTNGGTIWSSTTNYSGNVLAITGTKSDTIYWNSLKDLPSVESKNFNLRLTFQSTSTYLVVVDSVGVDNQPPRNLSVNQLQSVGWNSERIILNPATDLSMPIKYDFYFKKNSFVTPDTSITGDTLIWKGLPSLTDMSFVVRAEDALGNKDTNTTAHTFQTSAVGSFDGSWPFDNGDVAQVMFDWSNGDTVDVDMFPFTGNFPKITVKGDGGLNVNDVYVFAKMWLYSHQNQLPSNSVQSPLKTVMGAHADSTIKLGVDRDSRNSELNFSPNANTTLISCGIEIRYGGIHLGNGQSLRVDSVFFSQKGTAGVDNGLTLVYNDSINKIFYADYGLAAGFDCKGNTLARLKMKIPQFAAHDSMIVSLSGYDSQLRQALTETYAVHLVDIPSKFELFQNYPNPFNPSTIIQFDLPKPEKVKLVIYNVLGQRVTTLIDGNLDAGTYKYSFSAFRCASGVYFYVINAGTNRNVKKMMLLK